ncbi:MAG: DUF1294 domain-containing protein [Lachnospiraceae bacterium]|nr:DUF1294 domain-containing protein [Lachnospiraceae bacterium]
MNVVTLLTVYFIGVNLTGFILMGLDKRKAQKHLWRIPEATLFVCALIGGSIGSIGGMYFFHHKTRKWYFVVGMPLILFLQAAAVIALFQLPIQFITF